MRSISLIAPNHVVMSDGPAPDPGPDDVVVEGMRYGICGTDLKIVTGKPPVPTPRVLGHELAGIVRSAPGGSGLSVGQRVFVDPGIACGWCQMCISGRRNICLEGGLMGRDEDGVFRDLVAVPRERVIEVPDSVSDDGAGLLQVLGTCVHAVQSIDRFPGEVASVIGLGVGGQLITQLLSLMGLTVVGITRSEWKREIAAQSGAAAVASPDQAADILDDLTSGRGPALVVEAVGTEETLAEAITQVAVGGELLVFGIVASGGLGLPYYELYRKELVLRNPRAAQLIDYERGAELAGRGLLDLDPLITHVEAMDDVGEVLDLAGSSTSLKVLMAP